MLLYTTPFVTSALLVSMFMSLVSTKLTACDTVLLFFAASACFAGLIVSPVIHHFRIR
jgi:hypothetical protein